MFPTPKTLRKKLRSDDGYIARRGNLAMMPTKSIEPPDERVAEITRYRKMLDMIQQHETMDMEEPAPMRLAPRRLVISLEI